MLQVYKNKFYQGFGWTPNWMWQYSNPNLTLSDPKYLFVQTPVSGTINLTLTNNTGSVINNTYSTILTPTLHSGTYFYASSGSNPPKLYSDSDTSYHTYWYANTTGSDVTYYIKNLSGALMACGYYTTGSTPSTSGSTVTQSARIGKDDTRIITVPTGKSLVIGYAAKTTGFSDSMFELSLGDTHYTLSMTDSHGTDINVDLGQSTLAVNETITVPITLPLSTDTLEFYNNTGGAQIQGQWPEISFPYTGWSVKNVNDGFIKYSSSGSWT